MRLLVWGGILLSASWVTTLCLSVLLDQLYVSWLPPVLVQLGELMREPTLFAAWIGLPTLACLGAQIWQVQRVGVEQ